MPWSEKPPSNAPQGPALQTHDDAWPLVVVEMHRPLSPSEIERLLLEMASYLPRGEHAVMMLSHGTRNLDREGMQRIRRWMDDNRTAFMAACRGMAFVNPSMGPVRRFGISTMMALLGRTVPVSFHGDRASAEEWIRTRLPAARNAG